MHTKYYQTREEEELLREIVDCAYKVHVKLGPGLLERIYEVCFCHELNKKRINFSSQVKIPIVYGVGIMKLGNEIPNDYKLEQNYPNPFNPTTKVKFHLSKMSDVRLKVFDIVGREIITLVNERINSGTYETEFNGENYPSGIYFYRLESGSNIEVKKMSLIK